LDLQTLGASAHSRGLGFGHDFGLGALEKLVIQTVRDQMETDLLVASADEAGAAIRRAGGQVAVEPFEIPIGRCAVVRDPWGNVLLLLDGTKGSLTIDADGIVLTDASGAPRLKPRA
jgi:hypothetical protein